MNRLFYNLYLSSSKKSFWGIDDFWGRFWSLLFRKITPFYYKLTSQFQARLKSDTTDEYIVSLTTFPARIEKVWLTIESILRQSQKPDRILLWLYDGEFNGKKSLPKNLLKLQKRGLEIRFCNENLMPHKKYFYTMLEFPDANVITIDDDMFYPTDLIEKLLKYHKKYPDSIICPITRIIKTEEDKIRKYNSWKYSKSNTEPLYKNLTMGGGGTLFPTGSLHSDVFDLTTLKKIALKTDDLWLKVMSLRNNTKVVSIAGEYSRFFISIMHENTTKLMDSNIGEGQNDIVLQTLLKHYDISNSIFES